MTDLSKLQRLRAEWLSLLDERERVWRDRTKTAADYERVFQAGQQALARYLAAKDARTP